LENLSVESGSEYGQVFGALKRSNESSGSIKLGQFLNR